MNHLLINILICVPIRLLILVSSRAVCVMLPLLTYQERHCVIFKRLSWPLCYFSYLHHTCITRLFEHADGFSECFVSLNADTLERIVFLAKNEASRTTSILSKQLFIWSDHQQNVKEKIISWVFFLNRNFCKMANFL